MRITSYQRITIVRSTRLVRPGINEELQWLGSSLGLFNLRDKDKSCFRIFIELVKTAKTGQSLSSDELAEKLGLSRGTVVHHLNRLIDAGLVVADKKKYFLRVSNLEVLIDELERDTTRALEDLKQVEQKIDQKLGL